MIDELVNKINYCSFGMLFMNKLYQKIFIHEKIEIVLDCLSSKMLWIK